MYLHFITFTLRVMGDAGYVYSIWSTLYHFPFG